jgi:hypothetical protein
MNYDYDYKEPTPYEIISEEINIAFNESCTNIFHDMIDHLVSCGYVTFLHSYIDNVEKIETRKG